MILNFRMMETKMIWANLSTTDAQRTREFYTKLGFTPNSKFDVTEMTSILFGKHNFVINFFKKSRLEENLNGSIVDAHKQNEVVFSLSAESRDEVDQWVGKVKKAGAKIYSEPQDYEKGYTFGFSDPDGHKFNVLYWPGM